MENSKSITAKDIIEICKGELILGNKDKEIKSFSNDTRTLKKGEMYIGIKGETVDGNTFYKQALELGAVGCIVQDIEIENDVKEKYNDRIIIKVEDTIKALQELAKYKRSKYNIPVIAVTGSVGKTSTKDIIASVMKEKFNVLKTSGNFNNHIGLPLTILKLEEHDAMVIEMGMNHFGEISLLTKIAKPTVAVLTNIGTAHIGILGSRENILKAKLEILEGMEENAPIIINNDNDLLHKWEEENKEEHKIITYGIENKSDYMATNIKRKCDGSIFDIYINNIKYEMEVAVGGDHFIYNSLAGIAIGNLFKIEPEKIKSGIKNFELTKRRMEILKFTNDVTLINDSYNASYDSVKPAIEYLGKTDGNRKIAVLGDMLELGKYSKELHEKVGEEVEKNKIDLLVAVGELSKYISEKARKLGMNNENIIECKDSEEAGKKLKEIIQKGDTILLKASNAMKFNKIVEELNYGGNKHE